MPPYAPEEKYPQQDVVQGQMAPSLIHTRGISPMEREARVDIFSNYTFG